MAEEERAHAGAGDVDTGRVADLRRRDRDAAPGFRQGASNGADDGDLKAIENPDCSEPDQDHPVPPRPGQAIETSRDVRLDGVCLSRVGVGGILSRRRHPNLI